MEEAAWMTDKPPPPPPCLSPRLGSHHSPSSIPHPLLAAAVAAITTEEATSPCIIVSRHIGRDKGRRLYFARTPDIYNPLPAKAHSSPAHSRAYGCRARPQCRVGRIPSQRPLRIPLVLVSEEERGRIMGTRGTKEARTLGRKASSNHATGPRDYSGISWVQSRPMLLIINLTMYYKTSRQHAGPSSPARLPTYPGQGAPATAPMNEGRTMIRRAWPRWGEKSRT